jgi:hypothetical protein
MGKKISIPDYLKKYKFKIGPQISVTKGSSTPAPNVEVNTENRYYGVKGEYDIFNKKDSSLKISGSIGKGSGRADVNFPGGKQTFKGEGDMDKQFNIIFKKKFKKGGYNQGTCWDGYVQKGMKKKGNRMVPNCLPAMKTGGLTKWFNEKWVDIGARKKEVSRVWSFKICKLFIKNGVPEVRATCKSHTDDKLTKGICCQTKKSSW